MNYIRFFVKFKSLPPTISFLLFVMKTKRYWNRNDNSTVVCSIVDWIAMTQSDIILALNFHHRGQVDSANKVLFFIPINMYNLIFGDMENVILEEGWGSSWDGDGVIEVAKLFILQTLLTSFIVNRNNRKLSLRG